MTAELCKLAYIVKFPFFIQQSSSDRFANIESSRQWCNATATPEERKGFVSVSSTCHLLLYCPDTYDMTMQVILSF